MEQAEYNEPSDLTISTLPDEIKLSILTIGLKDIIKNNSVFNPAKDVVEYLNLIGLINKDFNRFKKTLYDSIANTVIDTFAHEEKNLTREEIDLKFTDTLSVNFSQLAALTPEEESEKEITAAKLIIAGLSRKTMVRIRHDNRSEMMQPLTAIAKIGKYIRLIPLLLFYGANIDEIDVMGNTNLICAVQANHINVAAELLKYGADTEQRSEMSGHTALELAKFLGNNEMVSLIKKYTNQEDETEKKSYCMLC